MKRKYLTEWKRFLSEDEEFDYPTIENLKDGGQLIKIIRDNMGMTDNEAVIEAAFIGLSKIPEFFDEEKNVNRLYSVLLDVSKIMNINKIYHKQSILKSLNKIGETSEYLPKYSWWEDLVTFGKF